MAQSSAFPISPNTPSALVFSTSIPEIPSPLSSHARRRQKGHVARPPNAFMLFRSIFWANEKLKDEPIERDHRDISRITAHCWNALDDAGKAPYIALAKQRKLQHELDHPGYKYRPAFPRERTTNNKKAKKSDDREETRCKKLASLVMDGVSSAGIREAMKSIDKKPSIRGTTSSRNATSRSRKAVSSRLPPIKEDYPSPKLESPLTYYDYNFPGDGFVATEDIPHLELSPVKKEEETLTIQFDPSIQLPTHNDLDTHFGVKTMHPAEHSFWNAQDNMLFEADLTSHISPSGYHQYGPVSFTDPFAGGPSHPSSMSGEDYSNFYPSPTSMNNDTYDSDMNEFFHFDY